MGIEADPRPKEDIERLLSEKKKDLEKAEGKEEEIFDRDRLWNPYTDSRILYGEEDTEIEGLLAGIDIGVGEVVLADRLREKGKEVNGILSHHPSGRAAANFYEVMHMQEEMMEQLGIGITVAEGLFAPRIKEVMQKVHPANHTQTVDACSLLDMPFLCLHTPSDNQVQNFLKKRIENNDYHKVKDVLETLYEIPEYDHARRLNAGPEVFVGDKDKKAGKVVVDMTGGTSGPKEMYEKLSEAGVGTLVGMHIPKDYIEEAKKNHINVVIAGHMASDSVGLNLILDRIESGGVSITSCSGFKRVKRS